MIAAITDKEFDHLGAGYVSDGEQREAARGAIF